MAGFYIKSVTAFGTGKTESSVDFIDGLNIITGISDTGKTCVIRCIDFIFGKKTPPFDPSTGYEGVRMAVSTAAGDITFERLLGKNQVEVTSANSNIESGTYAIEYKKNQKKPVLNEVWLRLIGIDEEHKVPANKNYDKKRLTWKTLGSLRFLDEDDIGRAESIIEPVQVVEKTLFLSSLLFLINGRDFSEVDAQAKRDIKKARRKAVEEYVNRKIQIASDKQSELAEAIEKFDGVDVDAELESIIQQIQLTDSQIAARVNSSRKLMISIVQFNSKLAECDVLLSRYDALATQYKADIKRLTFIVDGEKLQQQVPQSTKCPFCDGTITVKRHQSYISSANAELKRIMAQLKGLSDSVESVKREKVQLQTYVTQYQKEYDDIERLLQEELRPRLADLGQKKDEYKRYIELKNEQAMLRNLAENWLEDLRQLPSEDDGETELEYRPREYFGDGFLEAMDEYAMSILTECCYENLLGARFNLQDFDIEVNGGKKATNHGKGHRAFLNTVVALMFRKYMAEHAKFDPNFLMIDTPLLGLDQGIDDAAPESMRTALFNYFINHRAEGQMIVVENWEHIPKLNYDVPGVSMVKFMKGKTSDRYGFLMDVK